MKTPRQRTCVGCRTACDPADLVRMVADAGQVVFSATAPGRGAWIHPDKGCWEKAVQRRQIPRALRTSVTLPECPW